MNSPTLTTPAMTQAGMILGTAAYMAPEQARGRTVDKRADVWAFGAVLFEMLTGARAFPGEDLTDTLAAVVRAEPDWTLLPPGLPPTLVVYLKRCLQKDPKQRIPDMAAMRLALEGAFDTAAPHTTTSTPARHAARAGVGIGGDRRRVTGSRRLRAVEPARSRSADLGSPDHPASRGRGNHVVSGHHRATAGRWPTSRNKGRRIRSSTCAI